eukprot:TRINITY_DN3135_c0_g1_i1.p1 TRINITY_DN3135_c0_g1~~TRINITY_DN3135_c0_g1_i1.p1  ORF type:complete len:140 (+),score=24.64 TRINITY_DN3135_c0_g1_i1:447-866(+)
MLYKPTVGIEQQTIDITIDSKLISVSMWELCGEERFLSLLSSFCNKIHICGLIYDTSDPSTFKKLSFWKKHLSQQCNNDVLFVLFGNQKSNEESKISDIELKQWCDIEGVEHIYQSSAFDSTYIREMICSVVSSLVQTG